MAVFSAAGMLTQEQAVEVRVRARQGEGIRAIAQAMGVSRNTVRRYLRGAPAGKRQAAPTRASKLDPFKEYLQARVEAARPEWIPAVVLHREIVERGFTGGLSTVKRFLAPLKPMPAPDPVVRFETQPGRQMQADFVVFRRGDALSAFVATLGFSRASFVRFVTDERVDTVRRCLADAFEFFGGVPAEVLFDNARTIVIARNAYGDGLHRFHPRLLDLADQYGFAPRLCRPYRAKTKGKVERFNRFLRYSFYVPLAARLKQAGLALDAETANVEVARWLREVANVREHGTTGRRPLDALHEERSHLLPLPPKAPQRIALPRTQAVPLPLESRQHPLSVYQQFLPVEVA